MVHLPFPADPARQRRFLRAFDETRVLTVAARQSNIGLTTVQTARRLNPEFDAMVRAILAKPPTKPRKLNHFLPADRQRFLEALAATGCAEDAAAATPVPSGTAYDLRRRDRHFAAAWADARDDATDRAYGRMLKAAIEGFVRTEAVVDGVKRIVNHDPRSVLALLDRHRPTETAGGRSIEATPERLRAARASLVRKLTSGGGLTTMAEAIAEAAATTTALAARAATTTIEARATTTTSETRATMLLAAAAPATESAT